MNMSTLGTHTAQLVIAQWNLLSGGMSAIYTKVHVVSSYLPLWLRITEKYAFGIICLSMSKKSAMIKIQKEGIFYACVKPDRTAATAITFCET